jgi:SAM-dependent methyltransferase
MPLPRLYGDLAGWWPLLSHPDDYGPEADWIVATFEAALGKRPAAILELGSGGGNMASHLSKSARMTLVDLSPQMLAVSRKLNPGTEHIEGDMRTVRLFRTFDAVLIHDAIMYMTSEDDLAAALATARAHLDAGGAVLVQPDYVAETFEPGTEMGGHDADDGSGRGLRYMTWTHAPAAGTTIQYTDFAMLLRSPGGTVEIVHDRHTTGLFPRAAWGAAFVRAGFAPPEIVRDLWKRDVFVARPA